MKYLCLGLLLLIIASCHTSSEQEQPLFQITHKGKVGFIDSTGKIVIEPKFWATGDFSEGLAYARINGTYGYIDKSGNFVIQPRFDYATSFQEGLAIVYEDGKPYYINKKGVKAFESNFSLLEPFQDGIAIVKTATGKPGVIDKNGLLFIDTIYKTLSPFVDGLSIVEGLDHHPYPDHEKGIDTKYEIGVINAQGKFIIPYGKFEGVEDYNNGYFKVRIPRLPADSMDQTTQYAIIDKKGETIFTINQMKQCFLTGMPHCGLTRMHLYQYSIPEEAGTIYTSEKSYEGFVNLKGAFILDDTTFKTVDDFSDNRAFVRDRHGNYAIINTEGHLISKKIFNRILGSGFKDGVAFVAVDGDWGLIDTNGNFIIKPHFYDIHEAGLVGEYFFYKEDSLDSKNNYHYKIGIAKRDGSIITKPILEDIDISGFRDGLIKCIIQQKLSYLNRQGKIIWQEQSVASAAPPKLNIDFMQMAYFGASSTPDENDYRRRHYETYNTPAKISNETSFPKDLLSIVIDQNSQDTFCSQFRGFPVYLVNNTNSKIDFNAQNGNLYMLVQALNARREWLDIEYQPSSWCGNSYHTITLPSKHFWTFTTPKYSGDVKTRLRIKVLYISPDDPAKELWNKKEITIYSEEYEGSINPGQFWRKQDYIRTLMKPY